ncbi:MAG: ABC transporter ATP-binding protein [Thermodesulfobacteriota bacterium]
MSLLEVKQLTVCYEKAMILNGVCLEVDRGELVGLVGPNGAGKSTLLRAITGLVAWERQVKRGTTAGDITLEGSVIFDGEPLEKLPAHEIARRGLIHCPERRRPFRELTVLDNLYAGGYLVRDRRKLKENLEQVFGLFPVLRTRARQISGTLSGGEQQMLAIGRALMFRPKLLCIDEPSTGLSPLVRAEVFFKISQVGEMGVPILLVEQEVAAVFQMAVRSYVLSSGRIVAQGDAQSLLQDEVVRKSYLGM